MYSGYSSGMAGDDQPDRIVYCIGCILHNRSDRRTGDRQSSVRAKSDGGTREEEA